MSRSARGRALVLGASIAGLLAARVLADAYDQVVLVERDLLPAGTARRRGVPQDRHIHALHTRGLLVLEELFPGLTEEATGAGAALGDSLGGVRWYLEGADPLVQVDSGMPGLSASRPLLEGVVRRRVLATAGVELREGTDVVGTTSAGDRVTGARIASRADGTEVDLAADLIVDATGRGSRAPRWLAAMGFPAPEVERITIDLGYCTRHYRLGGGGGSLGTDGVLVAATPGSPRLGTIMPIEGDRHIVTLGGMLGDHPPTDVAGFTAFAATLPAPDIADALRDAEPLDDGAAFRFPADQRHHYERLRRAPAGFLVIGDAVCSFNPVYAQGMTVAAVEALVLRDLLRAHDQIDPLEWYRRIGPVVGGAWESAAGGDLAFPGVTGRRTASMRVAAAYLPRLFRAATRDADLARAVVRVVGMVDGPGTLLRPTVVAGALRAGRGSRARPRATSP
ncbi:FAD-dependent oxidoreductase [Pseudonocardia saturnea]